MEVAEAYRTYQQLLLENNALDFGDLINYTLKLFQTRKNILKKYQEQFKYILVDEFQDTNFAQYELVKLLAGEKKNITVVGDDDQCLPGRTIIEIEGGTKKIMDIKAGDRVATAVGRGYLSYSKVSRVFKTKKNAKILSFRTARGHELNVTDNHKLFCLTPSTDDKKYYFVYLMERQGLGWRIGVTNDLSLRLRLERSADKILGIKACESETEARFYETLYSLKFNIPTVCFKERQGVAIKDEWLIKLYDMIDTEANARKLAADLNIDLDCHHYSLGAVNRGSKLRIKINLEMCQRNYRSKYAKNSKLKSPKISHLLSLQTSDIGMVKKIRNAGYDMRATKKGYRLRLSGSDIRILGEAAQELQELTGGIMEVSAKLGRRNIHTLPSLVMPAKNVLVGQYLPVKTASGIIYDRVIEIKETDQEKITVYDLEVENTHNFIANGIVVHNSIYKFRGASVSNILQFKDDYPDAQEIYLTDNYRSSQNILDLSYKFIQRNNPDRLEVKLAKSNNLSKKLISHKEEQGDIRHLHGQAINDEVELVVNTIIEQYNKDKENKWSDFAILVRANHGAEDFCFALELAKVPYVFMASRGLYQKPIILNILSWFRVLDDYHESSAFYRVLNFPFWQIDERDIINLNYWSYRKGWSLYEVSRQNSLFANISDSARAKLKIILALLDAQSSLAKSGKKPTQILTKFLNQSGYLKLLTAADSLALRDELNCLNQFYRKLADYEKENISHDLAGFMDLMELELESGESGALAANIEDTGPEAVKIMTIHASKGLEFKHVFIANMVDKKFPSISKSDPIELPEALIKEIIPEGDIHLAEERRLFYVAMTRAKDGLYFSSAEDYGGARAKKLSRFLSELSEDGFQLSADAKIEALPITKINAEAKSIKVRETVADIKKKLIPKQFSFTQLKAYEKCPYQYRFAHILRIPLTGKPVFSFGKSMHSTMQKFFLLARSRSASGQSDLFNDQKKAVAISWEEVRDIYVSSFIDDWYPDIKTKDDYYDRGLKSLKKFFDDWQTDMPLAEYVEYGFTFKLNSEYAIRGAIDRIDKTAGGMRLVDYKTGSPKEKLAGEDKEQLLIYQMAAQEILRIPVTELAFYYFDNNSEISFLGKETEIEKLKEKIIGTIEDIKTGNFEAKPEKEKCRWCDYKSICDFAM